MENLILTILLLNALATMALGCALFFVIQAVNRTKDMMLEMDARFDAQILSWAREYDSPGDYAPFGELLKEYGFDNDAMSETKVSE